MWEVFKNAGVVLKLTSNELNYDFKNSKKIYLYIKYSITQIVAETVCLQINEIFNTYIKNKVKQKVIVF